MQKWDTITIQLGKNGVPDQAALAKILVTDDKHRIRSTQAEAFTCTAETKYPLPAQARCGGALGSDPNTKEQFRLTRGRLSLV